MQSSSPPFEWQCVRISKGLAFMVSGVTNETTKVYQGHLSHRHPHVENEAGHDERVVAELVPLDSKP